MRVSATLAWRYLIGRPGRTALTTLAITLGVALIFGLNGMMPGLADVFTKTLFAAAGQVDLTVSSPSGGNFERSIAEQVDRVAGIAVATPSLRKSVGMPNGSRVSVVTLVGTDPRTSPKVHSFNVSAGRMLSDGDSGQVVIGPDARDRADLAAGRLYAVLYTHAAPLGAGRATLVLPKR
ncbi:MAG: ABC transporter permease [Planctomycetota bacterium]